jgi:hypothetical protein
MRVAYSVQFLQSIGGGDLHRWRGTVIDTQTVNGVVVATVVWDHDPTNPKRVNSSNLATISAKKFTN